MHQAILYIASIASSTTQHTIVVVQSLHGTILYLASMEPKASPTTQHTIVVVQSAQILYLASVESATLSTTRDTIVVVPSLLMTVLCLDSMKPITSSTTRQIMRLVV